jgi:hypothetical protein
MPEESETSLNILMKSLQIGNFKAQLGQGLNVPEEFSGFFLCLTNTI